MAIPQFLKKLAGDIIINKVKSVVKSTLSKPENPLKTGLLSTGASGVLGTTSLLIAADSINTLSEFPIEQIKIDDTYQLIMSIIGIIISYGLSQYREHKK